MQNLIAYVANLITLLSLRALVSREAIIVYGILACVAAAIFGNVALVFIGIACIYFATRDDDDDDIDHDDPRDRDDDHNPTRERGTDEDYPRGSAERSTTLFLLAILPLAIGCEVLEPQYRRLPSPPPEAPVVNPHPSIRQSNWLGPNREGSCAHASLVNLLRWTGDEQLGEQWKRRYGGDGEYASRIRNRCEEMGIPFVYTEKANLALLDFAHATRRGAILWWKPAHCCTFCGWVKLADGRTYAVILDNNSVGQYELTERSQFHKLWAGYGGFALTPLLDPPSPPVYRSYELIEPWT
jgi:hypothetical protein